MRLSNKGEATAGEVVLIIVLFIMMGLGGWYALSKKTESNSFHDKSSQVVHNHYYITRKYTLLDFVFSPFNFGGCTRRPDVIGEDETETQDVNDLNAVVNTDKN